MCVCQREPSVCRLRRVLALLWRDNVFYKGGHVGMLRKGHSLDSILLLESSPLRPGGRQPYNGACCGWGLPALLDFDLAGFVFVFFEHFVIDVSATNGCVYS